MIYLITGHYGSGKSTVAANMAATLRSEDTGKNVGIVDMDTVNPYYRTADLKAFFESTGVELISPMYARTNLDIPILNFDLSALSQRYDTLIADMGGDDAGAYPLGMYRAFLENTPHEVLYVVNFRRMLTQTPEDALYSIKEIEAAIHLPVTGIINNTDLGFETDEDIIAEGIEKAKALSQLSNIPLKYSTFPDILQLSADKYDTPLKKIQILIKNSWDR